MRQNTAFSKPLLRPSLLFILREMEIRTACTVTHALQASNSHHRTVTSSHYFAGANRFPNRLGPENNNATATPCKTTTTKTDENRTAQARGTKKNGDKSINIQTSLCTIYIYPIDPQQKHSRAVRMAGTAASTASPSTTCSPIDPTDTALSYACPLPATDVDGGRCSATTCTHIHTSRTVSDLR